MSLRFTALVSPFLLLLSACTAETYQVTFPLPASSSSEASLNDSSASNHNERTANVRSSVVSHLSSEFSLPSSVKIDVPFQSQAPLQNWDALHEEACEEASLILVQRYLTGQTTSPQQMEDEIQKVVAWENAHGYAQDITVSQLKEVAQAVYGLHGTVLTDITVDSIKRQIAKGNPVIIPADGQQLGNPYFSGAGPPYHMLVIIGYGSTGSPQADFFVTDDVGTKRGANYRYSVGTIMNAIHDWTGSDQTIEGGNRAMLVLTK